MWFRRIFNAKPGAKSAPRSPADAKTVPARQRDGANALALSAQALRRLDRLQIDAGRLVPGWGAGQRSSAHRRPAMDFREHRSYTPGDDVRFVDWKASARQEHVFIKQGEQMKEATLYLVLDCSASMAWGSPPKSGAVLELAAALSYMTLAHGDQLLVLPVLGSGSLAPLGPLRGKGQFPLVLNYLRALPWRGQADAAQALATLPRRGVNGGVALLLSDLLGVQALDRSLAVLPQPTWNVGVLHLLHPLELEPALDGDLKMQDVETGQVKEYTVTPKALQTYRQRLESWRQQTEDTCRERRAFYSLIPTGWSLENQTLPHLAEKHLLRPL